MIFLLEWMNASWVGEKDFFFWQNSLPAEKSWRTWREVVQQNCISLTYKVERERERQRQGRKPTVALDRAFQRFWVLKCSSQWSDTSHNEFRRSWSARCGAAGTAHPVGPHFVICTCDDDEDAFTWVWKPIFSPSVLKKPQCRGKISCMRDNRALHQEQRIRQRPEFSICFCPAKAGRASSSLLASWR